MNYIYLCSLWTKFWSLVELFDISARAVNYLILINRFNSARFRL